MSSKLASDSCWESKGQFSLRAWHSTGQAPYLRIFAQHKLYLVSWERGWRWNWEKLRGGEYDQNISFEFLEELIKYLQKAPMWMIIIL